MAKKTATESILREKPGKAPKVKVNSDKRFKSLKSISIISVVLVIAICIVLNLILDITLDKKLTYDTTSMKAYSVSSVTSQYLKTLDKKVEIIGLFDRNDTSIEWRDYFLPLIDDYEAEANGKIEVKYVDPDKDPFIINQLDPENIYSLQKNTYVVKSGDMLAVVYPYLCFEYDADMQQYYGANLPVTNKIEETFTVNIVYVTSGRPLHAYYLAGHESPTHNSLDSMMKTLGFVTSDLNLKSSGASVPNDCELLIINSPKTDLSLSEKELIKTYLDNSGKVLVINDFNENKMTEFTNLNEVTRRMGVTLEQGLVRENNADQLMDVSDPYRFIAKVDSTYAKHISVPNVYSVEMCRYLKVVTDRPSNIYVSPLVVTSESASVEFQNSQIDANIASGTYPVILQCVDDSTPEMSCMIVIGTSAFTSDSYYSSRSLDDYNAVFMKQMLHDICPVEYELLIPQRKIPSYMLEKPLSSSSATAWSVVVMTVIPLTCLACGIFVYQRRRHL